jgi:hypothetical protein
MHTEAIAMLSGAISHAIAAALVLTKANTDARIRQMRHRVPAQAETQRLIQDFGFRRTNSNFCIR